MKRGGWLAGMACLLLLSCSSESDVAQRYRTERDLWQADWEFRHLSIRPQDVDEAQWTLLAQRYEGIAGRVMQAHTSAAQTEIRSEVQTLAARALFAAARVHAMLGDSNRVEQLFSEMASDYGHLPEVAAEVALARAGIAERRGHWGEAADLYQGLVERIEPRPGEAGAAGMVLDLPLQIARLRGREKGVAPSPADTHYGFARTYYEQQIQSSDSDLLQIQCLDRLAVLFGDMQDYTSTMGAMRQLESRLAKMSKPPRQPCEVRLAIAGLEERTGADPEQVRATLSSLLADYPGCPLTSQALMALAHNANRRDQVEEALGYLDRIIRDNQADAVIAPAALFARGQLLESRDRWPEALEIFRSLPAQHPLSEPALQAPLEVARHYAQAGDEEALAGALTQAERAYRDFIEKYPPGPLSIQARERLVQTLLLQERYDVAITESLTLGDALAGTPQGASVMIRAAGVARDALADTVQAAGILDQIAQAYAEAEVGRWAAAEAARLRGTPAP